MKTWSRRQFLSHAGVSVVAATQLGSLARVANAAPATDYQALVCILLAGGADSFNMLVPYDAPRYDAYAGMRSDLALARQDLLPLNYQGADGRQLALHPGMPELQQLFDAGDLAFIANAGPLAEPTTRGAYDSGSVRLPATWPAGKPPCGMMKP